MNWKFEILCVIEQHIFYYIRVKYFDVVLDSNIGDLLSKSFPNRCKVLGVISFVSVIPFYKKHYYRLKFLQILSNLSMTTI